MIATDDRAKLALLTKKMKLILSQDVSVIYSDVSRTLCIMLYVTVCRAMSLAHLGATFTHWEFPATVNTGSDLTLAKEYQWRYSLQALWCTSCAEMHKRYTMNSLSLQKYAVVLSWSQERRD